jgi:hypothetical protein
MNMHGEAAPVKEEKFLTPGVMVMLALIGVGLAFVAARFLFGIRTVANLNNQLDDLFFNLRKRNPHL